MPMSQNRQYREMPLLAITEQNEKTYKASGYATTFNAYPFFKNYDGIQIYEKFSPECFEDCDMSDVIFQLNHEGRVFARNSNGSLTLNIDGTGLHIDADLGRTEAARSIHEDINTGMLNKMSWGFRARIEPAYDKDTHTLIWQPRSIEKIYDVSVVSIPANNDTSINTARAFSDGVIEKAMKEFREAEEAKKKAIAVYMYMAKRGERK